MIGMIPEIQALEIKETLKNITPNVLKTLFVPIPENENIQFRSCQIFGTMGSGKTSLYRFIGKKAVEHYGEYNVNPIISTDMDALIEGINSQAVQVLFLDDAGLETQSVAETLVAKFTFIRHIFEEKRQAIDKKNGILLVLFAVQDYFLLAKKLRSTLHVEIFKHAPTNKSDISRIKEFLGELAIKVLTRISKKIFEEHKYEWLSTCIAKTISGRVGYFYYDFIPREDSILIEVEAKEKTIHKTYAITDGEYQFLEINEFINNKVVIDALKNWKNIMKKIKIGTDKIKQDYVDAFIRWIEGDTWDTIAEDYGVEPQSLSNPYESHGWANIVREEILGHIIEYQLTQEGQYYEGYQRFGGKKKVDLMSPNKDKAIEVKVRHKRESPSINMFPTDMIPLLEKGFPCELCFCKIRKDKKKKEVNATFNIYKVIKVTKVSKNPKQLYDLSTPSLSGQKVPEKGQAAVEKVRGSKGRSKGKKSGVIK